MPEADFIVVGAGITGVCAAHQLAKKGRDVVLLERDEVAAPCPIASSGDYARAFRFIYGADRAMTALCQESFARWREYEHDSGTELLVPCGMLVFGAERAETLEHWATPANARFATESSAVLKAAGLEHELLNKAQVVERYPELAANEFYDHAILDTTAGFIHARQAVRTIGTLAERAGAAVWEHTRVEECVRRGVAVERLVTNRGDFIPRKAVIFASGYMNGTLVPELASKIRITEHQILYLKPPDAAAYSPGKFPIVVDVNRWRYVFPVHGPGLMKVVDDDKYGPGRLVHQVVQLEPLPDSGFRDEARAFLRSYVPGLAAAEEIGSAACRYTNTASGKYLIYKQGNAVVLSACSGHGFKNAPMTARMAVALADADSAKPHYSSAEFGYQHADSF